MQYIVVLTENGCSASRPVIEHGAEWIRQDGIGHTALVDAPTPAEAIARAVEMRDAQEGGEDE